MADLIISKSKTKEAVKECNVSGEFYAALDTKVRELIKVAEGRAVANGRKTVRPQDLLNRTDDGVDVGGVTGAGCGLRRSTTHLAEVLHGTSALFSPSLSFASQRVMRR